MLILVGPNFCSVGENTPYSFLRIFESIFEILFVIETYCTICALCVLFLFLFFVTILFLHE